MIIPFDSIGGFQLSVAFLEVVLTTILCGDVPGSRDKRNQNQLNYTEKNLLSSFVNIVFTAAGPSPMIVAALT